MLCFRDMTFCSSETHKPDCKRQWTPELKAAAERWWGGPGAPVGFADLCGATPNKDNQQNSRWKSAPTAMVLVTTGTGTFVGDAKARAAMWPYHTLRQIMDKGEVVLPRPIDFAAFSALEEAICKAGYAGDIEWSETVSEPSSADDFAQEAIFVICNSGMRFTVAQGIFNRVMAALESGQSASTAFGHKGKCAAIDRIWRDRTQLLAKYLAATDKLAFCESLPFIGGITKYHLAKNFGADVAKPDVHLQRLADWEGTTPQALCERLARESGYRASTVDLILWRACAIGLINSRSLASADTHPRGGDVQQAPLVSGAVPQGDAQSQPQTPHGDS